MRNFANFGYNFQAKVLREIFENKDFAVRICGSLLKPEFFTTEGMQYIAKFCIDYVTKYNTSPTYEAVLISLIDIENKEEKDNIIGDLAAVKAVSLNEAKFVEEKCFDFCRISAIKDALTESVNILESEDDINVITSRIRETINNAIFLGFNVDVGLVYTSDTSLERYKDDNVKKIETGWMPIDATLCGGVSVGSLAVIMAPSGRGKSFALCNIAGHNIKCGKNVVYYTLEISDSTVAKRIDSYISGIPIVDLHNNIDAVKSSIAKHVTGRLIIKQFPTKGASVNDLMSHLKLLETIDFSPDLIIVDYADLIQTGKNGKNGGLSNSYYLLQDVYRDLRRMAGENSCVVFTASQVQRTSYNDDIIYADAIAAGISKIDESDLVLSFAQNDKELLNNTGRIFIAKSRETESFTVFPVEIDFSRAIFNIKSNKNDRGARHETNNILNGKTEQIIRNVIGSVTSKSKNKHIKSNEDETTPYF